MRVKKILKKKFLRVKKTETMETLDIESHQVFKCQICRSSIRQDSGDEESAMAR